MKVTWHRNSHNPTWKIYKTKMEDLILEVRQLRGGDQWTWCVWRGNERLVYATLADLSLAKKLVVGHAIHILTAEKEKKE